MMREVISAKKKRRRQMKKRRRMPTKLHIMQGKEKSRLGSRVKRGQGSTTMRRVMMRRKMRVREAAKGRVATKSSVCQTRKTPAQTRRTDAVPKGNTRSVLPTSICQMKMSHSEAKRTKRESIRKKSWNCLTAQEETKAKKRNLSKKGETVLPMGDPSMTKRIATMLQMRVKTESMGKSQRKITTPKVLRRKR